MFDYVPDLSFFFPSSVIAAVGKKQRSGLPEHLWTEGTQNAEAKGCSKVQWTNAKQIIGALI